MLSLLSTIYNFVCIHAVFVFYSSCIGLRPGISNPTVLRRFYWSLDLEGKTDIWMPTTPTYDMNGSNNRRLVEEQTGTKDILTALKDGRTDRDMVPQPLEATELEKPQNEVT